MPQQLLLFEETKEESLRREMEKLKEHCEKQRKCLFAKTSALTKLINEVKADLDIINANICKKPNQKSFL